MLSCQDWSRKRGTSASVDVPGSHRERIDAQMDPNGLCIPNAIITALVCRYYQFLYLELLNNSRLKHEQ